MIERARLRELAPHLIPSFAEKLGELEVVVSRQAERFGAILDIGAALSSARDLDALLKLVIDRVSSLIHAEAATLFMLDEERGELWSRVLKGSTLKEIRVDSSKGIVGHVVSTGQTLHIEDAYADPRFNPEIDRLSGFKTRSIIAVPLRHVSGRILGVLEVLHRKVNAFSLDDLPLLEAVAAQIAGVLDNVLLVEKLKQQNAQLQRTQGELSEAVRELDLLYEVEKAMSSTGNQADLLDRILVKAIEVSGASAGSILLAEDDEGTLYFRSATGEKAEVLTTMRLAPGKGIAGHVAETGDTMRLEDVNTSPYYDRAVARKLGVSLREILCVPIPGERDRLGALELLNKKGGFSAADERIATLLAGQTGRAILQRRAREEGERKGRLASIGRMLSSVLHDLRTPLTIVAGYVQLIAEEERLEERMQHADTIQKQINQIDAMTRETLAFARGEQELLVRRVYLHKFLAEVEEFLRRDFEGRGVELRMLPGYEGAARFDENKMKRVVYNIARNAAQAMPDGGRFSICVEKEDRTLVFRFQDNGPGVPEEIADRLFEEFVTAGKKGGTGLGLAIVKKIAEEHGGTVECRSRPGKGTTFEVRIPA
ncbi:MAG: GAF domain-containing sensor histidine kinase [Myxococcaceae bacterium]